MREGTWRFGTTTMCTGQNDRVMERQDFVGLDHDIDGGSAADRLVAVEVIAHGASVAHPIGSVGRDQIAQERAARFDPCTAPDRHVGERSGARYHREVMTLP